jgi:HlyD family secretion protein
MSRKKWIIGGVVGLAVVAVGATVLGGRGDAGVEVRLEPVQARDLVSTVTASGKIKPQTQVDISSDITGRIIDLRVKEGDWVKSGDLLIRIDPSTFEASVARGEAMLASARANAIQAKANRDQAERAARRSRELRTQNPNLVSDEQLEQAETQFQVAEAVAVSAERQVDQAHAGLQEARDQLAKTVLRAPMDGQVTRVAVEQGEVAVPGTFSRETGLLMTVSDLSVIQVNVQVDETDVVRLVLGDSAEITIDAFPDSAFSGRVTKISQSSVRLAPASGSSDRAVDYDVEVTLDNPPPDVRPDLSATAKIVTDTRDSVLSVPIISLTLREHTPMATENAPATGDTTKAKETEGVFVVVNGTAQFRPVKVGISGEEHFEVLSGLAAGDTIVAGPYQAIRDLSDSARVRAAKTTPAEGRRT